MIISFIISGVVIPGVVIPGVVISGDVIPGVFMTVDVIIIVIAPFTEVNPI